MIPSESPYNPFRCVRDQQLVLAKDGTSDVTSVECSDCSYTYEDMHVDLLTLRERLWEGYMLGGFGDYLITDFLEANFTSCALDGTSSALGGR